MQLGQQISSSKGVETEVSVSPSLLLLVIALLLSAIGAPVSGFLALIIIERGIRDGTQTHTT